MGNNNSSRHAEHLRLFGKQNTDTHCYGLDRYSWQQGENAKFGFQIMEDKEPALVAKGGGSGSTSETWKLYQKEIGSLCATDYKWVQQEQVMQNKLIIQKR